ncbi:MAG: lysine--tRNA ligase [Candidatus Sericytochromatia bacterium]|nr:lysine--tRNA ligase [Candidatus Tanganyikabacteria bacterium]
MDTVHRPTLERSEQERVRLDKLASMQDAGIQAYPPEFRPTATTAGLHDRYANLPAGEDTTDIVRLAGRIVSRRTSGKLCFMDLVDGTHGRIQIFADLGGLGEEAFRRLTEWVDLGDILGVEGHVRRTRRGELSVQPSSWTMLAKALRPLPEKWHGLTDVEVRYRARHLDLITNPEVREAFIKRSRAVSAIRRVLDAEGFLEVETPMLHAIPGGAAARPFLTHHQALDLELHLRISPELYLKRLVVGGLERVYEINRSFRNEGISTRHNPEFTMIEVYQAYADYSDMMTLTERLVAAAATEACGGTRIPCQQHPTGFLDLTPPWPRRTMQAQVDLFLREMGHDPDALDLDARLRILVAQGGTVPREVTPGSVLAALFDCFDSRLLDPVFITDFPVEVSPLAKRHRDDPSLTERFEVFILGRELANAFSELNDPLDQRGRFEAQAAAKASGDEEAHAVDEDYLGALEQGMPPTGGLGIGIDRLAMLLCDAASIRDVILFPLLRPRA